jgi:Tfp pilus assembly protein PilF
VLDLRDLPLSGEQEQSLADSLSAYRSGDLLGALAEFPGDRRREIEDGRSKVSEAERVYYAALLLSVGQVEQTEAALSKLSAGGATERIPRLATALRVLIAAVKLQPSPSTLNPQQSTELLASSYYEQSRAGGDESLKAALRLARQAAINSPDFGFAWERVAELEFSFGHTGAALDALNKGLALAPRNAQALALKGFLLAAQNRTREAIGVFDQAIAADSALGNAWLGRGLCRIRLGEGPRNTEHGPRNTFSSHFGPLPPAIAPLPSPLPEPSALDDLLIAAALEPQRSLLRSYLGKAYADASDDSRASKELKLARELDKNDPTPWLYSALLRQQQNRINEAIADIETSQELNDNRGLFRSRLLLDEDRAVGGANLASIYRDAGMTDVSVREAARAVTYDYANASAHLFLADSYNELRDAARVNLRYETVWFNELLLANLLSPVGGGRLSQHVSQQEYSRLFEADGLHLASSTIARSDNKSVMELASQFGTFGGTSYSLDLDYDYQRGVRPNNDLSSIEWYSTIKQQVSPQATLLAQIKFEDYHAGDNFQYYDPSQAHAYYRRDERQAPIVVGGGHYEWSAAAHTLLLVGHLEDDQSVSDRAVPQILLIPTVPNYNTDSVPFDARYHSRLEIYTAELNQILQWNRFTLSAGARYQQGTFDTAAQLYNPARLSAFFREATNAISVSESFERSTGYGYATVEPLDGLWLTGGAAYDSVAYPDNLLVGPLSPGEAQSHELGPKAGVVWSPVPLLTLRGAYTRSIGGVGVDESYRLEPTRVAGFPQALRSAPASVLGAISAPTYTTYAAALDLKFPTGTYAGIQAERLDTDADRRVGVLQPTAVVGPGFIPPFVASSTLERIRYREDSVSASVNQLVGEGIVLGASYRFSHVESLDAFPQVPAEALQQTIPDIDRRLEANLHEGSGYVLYNHPSGFFARAETHWYHQHNFGYAADVPGDDFFQHNLFAGYRFAHRRAEITLGILNVSGEDYHLNPLTTYAELPRRRAFAARLNFLF